MIRYKYTSTTMKNNSLTRNLSQYIHRQEHPRGSIVEPQGLCNELGMCQGPISHNNEQTQSVEGII